VLATTVSAALSTHPALAALPYADGDLLLGFRATGGTGSSFDYLVNLGNSSVYRNATNQLTLSLGNLDAALDALFGPSWSSRTDVLWGIAGVQNSAGNGLGNRTLMATQSQTFPLAAPGLSNSTPWNRATTSTQNPVATRLVSLGSQFAIGTTGAISGTDQIQSSNSPFALIQPVGQPNSWRSYMPGGVNSTVSSAFQYFNDADAIEGNFGLGASGAALDLYIMQTDTAPFDPGLYEGTFTISDNAELVFTPQGVPEPSSALMFALGGSALSFIRRRQRA
jgi:hypothetical protein